MGIIMYLTCVHRRKNLKGTAPGDKSFDRGLVFAFLIQTVFRNLLPIIRFLTQDRCCGSGFARIGIFYRTRIQRLPIRIRYPFPLALNVKLN